MAVNGVLASPGQNSLKVLRRLFREHGGIKQVHGKRSVRDMGKVLCIIAMVISTLLLLIFLLDAAAGIPFHRANIVFDIIFIVVAAMIGVLSFFSFRQVRP